MQILGGRIGGTVGWPVQLRWFMAGLLLDSAPLGPVTYAVGCRVLPTAAPRIVSTTENKDAPAVTGAVFGAPARYLTGLGRAALVAFVLANLPFVATYGRERRAGCRVRLRRQRVGGAQRH
ncbi:hypothetical protein TOK_5929 [Pseudonocardia sp. N23]|nr:hypothetical protein TOK_5929 [Pseudonocardia sp. N23]